MTPVPISPPTDTTLWEIVLAGGSTLIAFMSGIIFFSFKSKILKTETKIETIEKAIISLSSNNEKIQKNEERIEEIEKNLHSKIERRTRRAEDYFVSQIHCNGVKELHAQYLEQSKIDREAMLKLLEIMSTEMKAIRKEIRK